MLLPGIMPGCLLGARLAVHLNNKREGKRDAVYIYVRRDVSGEMYGRPLVRYNSQSICFLILKQSPSSFILITFLLSRWWIPIPHFIPYWERDRQQ